MLQFKALKISIDVPSDIDNHNHDLVGYVISKYPRKIVKATILTRESVEHWYNDATHRYAPARHTFLIGTVSLVGVIFGTQIEDAVPTTNPVKDPSAN